MFLCDKCLNEGHCNGIGMHCPVVGALVLIGHEKHWQEAQQSACHDLHQSHLHCHGHSHLHANLDLHLQQHQVQRANWHLHHDERLEVVQC